MTLNPYTLYQHGLRSPKWRKWVILFTVIYIISPIDIIPDWFIPAVGLIDDGILLTVFVSEMVRIYVLPHKSSLKNRKQTPKQARIVDVEVEN